MSNVITKSALMLDDDGIIHTELHEVTFRNGNKVRFSYENSTLSFDEPFNLHASQFVGLFNALDRIVRNDYENRVEEEPVYQPIARSGITHRGPDKNERHWPMSRYAKLAWVGPTTNRIRIAGSNSKYVATRSRKLLIKNRSMQRNKLTSIIAGSSKMKPGQVSYTLSYLIHNKGWIKKVDK